MKFLSDMRISQKTVEWLRTENYDSVHLREENLHKMKDEEIFEKAKKEDRIILTCDLDFGAILALSHSEFPSVILFRLSNERPENINKYLKTVLSKHSDDLKTGCIITVEDNRYRIRMLPI